MEFSLRNLIFIMLGIGIAVIIALGMNQFLNIMVQEQATAQITQKSTWKQAGDKLEHYFETQLPQILKQKFVGWKFYDFTALVAGLLLIAIGFFLPSFVSVGFVWGGLLLLAIRMQTISFGFNLLIWLVCAIFAFLIARYKLKG